MYSTGQPAEMKGILDNIGPRVKSLGIPAAKNNVTAFNISMVMIIYKINDTILV